MEDKEQNGEGMVPTEKFSGWGKAETEQSKGTAEVNGRFAFVSGNK